MTFAAIGASKAWTAETAECAEKLCEKLRSRIFLCVLGVLCGERLYYFPIPKLAKRFPLSRPRKAAI